MLLNTAMLETRGSKVRASWSRKAITNHNSIDASKIHSATTNCPKQKYSSLYRQVPPIAEGYHKSNQEAMFAVSIQNGSGDLLREQSHCHAVTSGVTGTYVLLSHCTFSSRLLHEHTGTTARIWINWVRAWNTSAIYRSSSIWKCQSSLTTTTELRK